MAAGGQNLRGGEARRKKFAWVRRLNPDAEEKRYHKKALPNRLRAGLMEQVARGAVTIKQG